MTALRTGFVQTRFHSGFFVFLGLAITVLFAGALQYVAGGAFLIALGVALALFPQELRGAMHTKRPFFKAYFTTICLYIAFVIIFALFGQVGAEGWLIVVELASTLVVGMGVARYFRITGKDALKAIVVISFVHASFLMLIAFVQVVLIHHLDGFRAGGDINSIIYAHIMLTSAGIFAVWLFQFARKTHEIRWFGAFLAWVLLAIIATYLTGSRGPLLVFYPFLVGLVIVARGDGRRNVIAVGCIVTLALAALTLLIMESDRFVLGVNELSQSLDGHQNDGSVGLRLQFWQEALRMIKDKPIFGNGLRFFGQIAHLPDSSPLLKHNHVHNQFLDIWMKSGLAGVGLFVMLHGIPLVAGWKLIVRKIDETLGLVLVWLSGSFLVFGLTDIFITRLGTVTIYCTYLVIFLLVADRKLSDAPAT